jgi:hypothetical protein
MKKLLVLLALIPLLAVTGVQAKHIKGNPTCVLTVATITPGTPTIFMNGSGYTPLTTYLQTWTETPSGTNATESTLSDANGNLGDWTYAYSAGTYSVSVFTLKGALVATCAPITVS